MNFELFEAMDVSTARRFLEEYRRLGATTIDDFEEVVEEAGPLDFSLGGLRTIFRAVASSLDIVPREPDLSLPEWIRATPEYEQGLFDFDARSQALLSTLSYYLGESFVRALPGTLRWTTGDAGTAEENQPVIEGFAHRIQMAPSSSPRTCCAGVITEPDPAAADDVDLAVKEWLELAGAQHDPTTPT